MKRAVIYTRISKDLRQGAGVARQEQACRDVAARNGYTVVETLTDNDRSAFSGKRRPGYERLLEVTREGQIDVIICWHTDRQYRRLADLEGLIEACKANQVTVETVEGGGLDLNTASGRMIAGMLAVQSRHEVDHQIERQQAGHADRAARGRYRGGPVTFGFQTIPGKPGCLAHHPKEAEAVRYAADAILEGKSLTSIAKYWLRMGVIAKGSQTPWSAAKVRKRMSSPRIAGLEPYKGEMYPATTYEPIISEPKWRAVMGVLKSHESISTRGSERRWIGTGIFFCGVCGGKLNTTGRTGRGPEARSYTCPTCKKVSRKIIPVDQLVESVVLDYLDQPQNRIQLTRKDTEEGGNVQEMLDELRAIEARQIEIATLFADGAVTNGQLTAATRTLRSQSEAIARRIEASREDSPLSSLILSGDDLRGRWAELTPTQKMRVIDELLKVTIVPVKSGPVFRPEGVQIEWRF